MCSPNNFVFSNLSNLSPKTHTHTHCGTITKYAKSRFRNSSPTLVSNFNFCPLELLENVYKQTNHSLRNLSKRFKTRTQNLHNMWAPGFEIHPQYTNGMKPSLRFAAHGKPPRAVHGSATCQQWFRTLAKGCNLASAQFQTVHQKRRANTYKIKRFAT